MWEFLLMAIGGALFVFFVILVLISSLIITTTGFSRSIDMIFDKVLFGDKNE